MKCITIAVFFVIAFFSIDLAGSDVNVVGYIKFANGLGRVATTWIDVLSRSLDVNFINTRKDILDLHDVVPSVVEAAKQEKPLADVSLLIDNIWLPNLEPHTFVPDSLIKIAYSMCESTKIPQQWTETLNDKFDAVVVPDTNLIGAYRNSGVTIPIFVLPIALYLEEFLKVPLRKKPHEQFTFGVSAALSKNKNVSLLVKAFAEEFGNETDVILKIHTPWEGNLKEIKALIKKLKVKNVSLSVGHLSWTEYIDFMKSIDCYTLLSKGEGFSITVREAMALGLPCIISDNTAHKTITATGLVYSIPSPIVHPSDREFYQVDVGNNFDCHEEDVRAALRKVYTFYGQYLKKAQERRTWTKQYLREKLQPFYVNLIKPKELILGEENKITETYLMTDSVKLYEKYKKLKEGILSDSLLS